MQINELIANFAKVQEQVADGPIVPNVTVAEIRQYLEEQFDFQAEKSLEEITSAVETMLQRWQVQVTHPRYFGLFNPSVTVASVVADTLVAMYNSQLANWRTSPAGNEVERHVLTWLSKKFGLPEDSSAMFTSGGTEANLSAVIVALTRSFPGYGEDGLRGLPASPVIYLTQEAHNGYNKIAHIAGLGRKSLRIVATTNDLKLDIEDLRRKVAEDRANGLAPCMVVGTAGTTAAGVIDPLAEISQLCREENLWFHCDAAWGGAAVLSPELKPWLEGIGAADSITCDAHKWLSVPMGAGMFFCRHADTVAEAFRANLSYMPVKTDHSVSDPYTTSIQWSRRFIGLKLFMSLAQNGERGYAGMIEHQAQMGDLLRELLKASGWTIVNDTPLPVICFTRAGLVVSDFLASLRDNQVAWMSEAQIKNTPVVRACITSFRTTEADIRWVVDEMTRLFQNNVAFEEREQPVAASA